MISRETRPRPLLREAVEARGREPPAPCTLPESEPRAVCFTWNIPGATPIATDPTLATDAPLATDKAVTAPRERALPLGPELPPAELDEEDGGIR